MAKYDFDDAQPILQVLNVDFELLFRSADLKLKNKTQVSLSIQQQFRF